MKGSKSHSIVTVVKQNHIDMILLTPYEVRNLIPKLTKSLDSLYNEL